MVVATCFFHLFKQSYHWHCKHVLKAPVSTCFMFLPTTVSFSPKPWHSKPLYQACLVAGSLKMWCKYEHSKTERNQPRIQRVFPIIAICQDLQYTSPNPKRVCLKIGCPTAPWLLSFGHRNCNGIPKSCVLIVDVWDPVAFEASYVSPQ